MRWMMAVALLLLAMPAVADEAGPTYRLNYEIVLKAGQNEAEVSLTVGPGRALRQLSFTPKPGRQQDFRADGEIKLDGARRVWQVPARGGTLRWRAPVAHQRRDDGYDAFINERFAIFRGDDLIPAFRARAVKGASSRATLRFKLPPKWSVQTGWSRTKDRSFRIDNPERRFDRPTGWMIAGELGVRLDRLDASDVMVAAPVGSALHRMDVLVLLNMLWPEYQAAFGEMPRKVLIVGAGDPMWRGGLSAPNSMFLHADRPLVSENGTSTLAHELVHVVTRIRAKGDDDWIVEGLAEYYAIELLHRAGGLTAKRRDDSLRWVADFGAKVSTLKARRSSSRIIARATALFAEIDRELRRASGGQRTLDDVVRELMTIREVSQADLARITTRMAGRPLKALDTPLLAQRD